MNSDRKKRFLEGMSSFDKEVYQHIKNRYQEWFIDKGEALDLLTDVLDIPYHIAFWDIIEEWDDELFREGIE